MVVRQGTGASFQVGRFQSVKVSRFQNDSGILDVNATEKTLKA
jgi:hypothetical protein